MIKQFLKFILVGVLNTFIDFGLLNLLMFLTKIYTGPFYALFKGISFSVAVVNSYFLNKRWTFQSGKKIIFSEFLKFLTISCFTLFINVSTAYYLNSQPPFFNLSQEIWANLSAVGATIITTFINFFAYRYLFLKKK
ncbi:MAG: GtrA family protein [Minisyncoccia bacterium]